MSKWAGGEREHGCGTQPAGGRGQAGNVRRNTFKMMCSAIASAIVEGRAMGRGHFAVGREPMRRSMRRAGEGGVGRGE